MNFLERLTAQRIRPVSVVHQYRLWSRRNSDDVVFVVEGPDDESFLRAVVRQVYTGSRKMRYLPCGGKRGVLGARTEINKKGMSFGTTLYFVDKDVDELVGGVVPEGTDIFCTTCYSIENYLVSAEMLDVVWSEVFRLSAEDRRRELAQKQFAAEYNRFAKTMRTVMGWVIKRRRSGERVVLNQLKLEDYFRVDRELRFVKRRGALGKMRARCVEYEGGVEWQEVRRVCEELKCFEVKTYLRGKFDLWFFVKFVTRLEEGLRKADDKKLRPRNPLRLSVSNALFVLAARWRIDASLAAFLRDHLVA